MLRHHEGSGRLPVVGTGWSAHHRPVANATHTCTISMRRPGGTKGAFDPAPSTYPVTPSAPYYTGKARIQMVSDSDLKRLIAGQDIGTLAYRVSIDHNVGGIELEDLVTITAIDENGDASLVGRSLTVDTVTRSSLHWERVMVCIDDLERLN